MWFSTPNNHFHTHSLVAWLLCYLSKAMFKVFLRGAGLREDLFSTYLSVWLGSNE